VNSFTDRSNNHSRSRGSLELIFIKTSVKVRFLAYTKDVMITRLT
jgi:hypothetical protein